MLRHSLRAIAHAPILSAVIVVSIGLGIGANTVVFSWIQARVLKPLPGIVKSAGFYGVEARTDTGMYAGSSWLEYKDLRERLRSVPDLFAFRMVPLYVGETGRVERAYGLLVSDNYFSALKLEPLIGRFFAPAEVSRPGAEPVAVISYGLWQSGFGGTPDALGKTVRLNGRQLTVIGVTPREFQGTVLGLNFEVWLPATLGPVVINGSRELDDRKVRGYNLLGRLAESTTRDGAQRELTSVMGELARTYPDTNANVTGEVLPIWQAPRGPQRMLNTALAILQGIMLLLLLAVCGNTANLVLARASVRHREMGIRLALGAAPHRVAILLLAENVILGVLGAALGAAAAVWGTKALLLLPLTGVPIRFQTSVDSTGLAFAMTLGVLSGLLFGAAPALHLSRVDPLTAFRAASRTSGRSPVRNALMGVQVALALMVLIVAGMFFRSFLEARETDPGFRREGVLLAAFDLSGRNGGQAFTRAFPARLLERVRALPAVEAAALGSSVPLDIHGLPSRMFAVDGHVREDGNFDEALANTVTPGYFTVMGISVLTGRDFADLNDPASPPQAVVNEEFVRRYLPGLEAIGRRLQARGRAYTIVGIVRNSTYNAFGEPAMPIIYFSYRDNPLAQGELHVLTRGGRETDVAPVIRKAVQDLDPELPLFNVRTLAAHVETNLVFRRIPARMFVVLGPLLLVLAAIGVYAVVAYSVSQRTTEIGVRLALGATARRVVTEFVGQSLGVIGIGALAGWLIALFVALDVVGGPLDLPVFVVVPAMLLSVAAFASWLPAERATRMDPMTALKRD